MATRAPWPRASDAAVPPGIETPFPIPAPHWRAAGDDLERSDSGSLGAAGPRLPWCPRNLLTCKCKPRGGGCFMPDRSPIGNGDAATLGAKPIPVLDTLTAAFQHAMIGMAVWTPDGRLIDANRAFSRMFGYEHHDFLTYGFAQISHPDDPQLEPTQWPRLVAGE